MNKFCCRSIILSLVIPSVLLIFDDARAARRGVEIISSSINQCEFQVDTDWSRLYREVGRDSSLVVFTSATLGIPYGATVSVARSDGLKLMPVPEMPLSATSLTRSLPLVELSRPFEIRGHQFVTATIYPVTGTQYYSQVNVTLSFAGGDVTVAGPGADPIFDKIFTEAVVNYDQAKNFPQAPRADRAAKRAAVTFSGEWVKIEVTETGMYQISGTQLQAAGLGLAGVSSSNVRLYSGGGLPLPVDATVARPALQEVAIIMEDGGDGTFTATDRILFYGEAPNRWIVNNQGKREFVNNVYERSNYYWLSTAPEVGPAERMAEVNVAPTGAADTIITSFQRPVHAEMDKTLLRQADGEIDSYYRWYWSSDSIQTFFVATPDVVPGAAAEVVLHGSTADTTGFLDGKGYIDLTVNGVPGEGKNCNSDSCLYTTTALEDGLNQIVLGVMGNRTARGYFDFLDMVYSSRLVPSNDTLTITLDGTGQTAEMDIQFTNTNTPFLLDISDPMRPRKLVGFDLTAVQGATALTFEAALPNGTPATLFFGASTSAYLQPTSIVVEDITDLRQNTAQSDVIVVTPRAFVSPIQEWVNYRGNQGHRIRVTTVEDIMENLSWGMYDPTAIRDYLKYAYENWAAPAPSMALFVGDGTYDFLDRFNLGVTNLVPPYIFDGDETSSDDNYVYFGKYGLLDSDTSYNETDPSVDRGYDMVASRWPVKNTTELATVIGKIFEYGSTASLGRWRTRVALVADDEFGTFDNEIFHTIQTEELVTEGHIPRLYTADKIYLWDYPTVNGRKPSATAAIIDAFNEGSLLVNYVGHGNPDVWAHERVLVRTNDIPKLNNIEHLPLVYSASCAIGFFDDPAREGMAEDFLAWPNGGAIGVISATRLVYSAPNAQFNKLTYDILFDNPSLSIAQAMFAAKVQRQYAGTSILPLKNDRAFAYFGDPVLHLDIPQMSVVFDEMPDSLVALMPVTVSGRVVDQFGATDNASGELSIAIFDSDREKVHRLLNPDGTVQTSVNYSMVGPMIYRGAASINAGQFSFTFVPPLDISYGGQSARISVYSTSANTDGAGLVDSIPVARTVTATADSAGPEITVSFASNPNFISGGSVRIGDAMAVGLSDLSGVNVAGGLGHGITLTVDGETNQSVDLTNSFAYDIDNYTSGAATYQLIDIAPGEHTFKIKAWDNANNYSSLEFTARVQENVGVALNEVLNYPNPMQDTTRFYLMFSGDVSGVSLEIFTLSGRKIRTLYPVPDGPGAEYTVKWSGDDAGGRRVATGVYLYKASARPFAGGEPIESFGKVVVIN